MTTRPDHREPLDAEERELAARLARVGPTDGPTPALDAKILAAAHAAAATSRRPNRRRAWFAWVGVPPALVTGVGVAAAAVLALGLVWQLRPRSGVPVVYGEASGVEEEVFVMVEPAGAPRAPVANPPPFPTEAPAAAADTAGASAAKATTDGRLADQSARAAAEMEAARAASQREQATADDEARRAAAMAAAGAEAAADPGFVASPPPPPAPAPAPTPAAAPTPDTVARKQARASYTTAARATAERRERSDAAPAAATAPVAQESDVASLDRIEVTGSRIARGSGSEQPLADLPVTDDVGLAAADWLQRIRDRREQHDLDGARASLRLFRREHPRVRIPDDLRTLLSVPAPAENRQ